MNGFPCLIQRILANVSFFVSRLIGAYTFSRNDLFLYITERSHIQRPDIIIRSHFDNDLIRLEIGGHNIFWPSAMAYDDLSWLYGEVFAPWSENPSSYDHPVVEIGTTEWIVDAGACEGFFSLFALEQGAKRVVAVEPLEPVCRALRKTFAEPAAGGRFVLFEGALGQAAGTAHITIDQAHPWDSAVVAAGEGLSVIQTTLDELGELFCLEAGGMIKMDIEGAEMDALRGATRLLRDYKPKLAVAVYHGYENANLCAEIIQSANPAYTIEFRGMYGWFRKPRPYMLTAW
jgi:FkbM family methyltransferase